VVYSNKGQNALFIASHLGTNSWTSKRFVGSAGPHSTATNDRTNSVFIAWQNRDLTGVDALQLI
jgi:hypothetical protein